jgi:transcription elongation factor Elf1
MNVRRRLESSRERVCLRCNEALVVINTVEIESLIKHFALGS